MCFLCVFFWGRFSSKHTSPHASYESPSPLSHTLTRTQTYHEVLLRECPSLLPTMEDFLWFKLAVVRERDETGGLGGALSNIRAKASEIILGIVLIFEYFGTKRLLCNK